MTLEISICLYHILEISITINAINISITSKSFLLPFLLNYFHLWLENNIYPFSTFLRDTFSWSFQLLVFLHILSHDFEKTLDCKNVFLSIEYKRTINLIVKYSVTWVSPHVPASPHLDPLRSGSFLILPLCALLLLLSAYGSLCLCCSIHLALWDPDSLRPHGL